LSKNPKKRNCFGFFLVLEDVRCRVYSYSAISAATTSLSTASITCHLQTWSLDSS
jgi:hypothetical protein